MKYVDILGILLPAAFISRIVTHEFDDAVIVQIIAFNILYYLAVGILFIIGSHYINLVLQASSFKRLLTMMFYSIMGAFILSIVSLYDFELIKSDSWLVTTFIGFMGYLFMRGHSVSYLLVSRLPLREEEKRMIADIFPPQQQSDIWRFHLFIVVILIMPILVKRIFDITI